MSAFMYLAHFDLHNPPFQILTPNDFSPAFDQGVTERMTKKRISQYLTTQLQAAGYRGPAVFSPVAIDILHKVSGGQMQQVNILADKSLLAAFIENTHWVQERHVLAAMRDSEIVYTPVWYEQKKWRYAVSGFLFFTFVAGIVVMHQPSHSEATPSPVNVISEQSRNPSLNSARADANKPLVNQRIEAAGFWLTQIQESATSIQLFVTEDDRPAKLERFLHRAAQFGTLNQLYILPIKQNKKSVFQIIYGQYSTLEAANTALNSLPEKYKAAFKPVVCKIKIETQTCQIDSKD
jgi:hypothetical protein